MKTIMIIFLLLFLAFGAVGLVIRLTHDWSKLQVETDKLSDTSTAKRDGKAMQLIKHENNIDAAKLEARARRMFRLQWGFSILSGVCLVLAVVCGVLLKQMG